MPFRPYAFGLVCTALTVVSGCSVYMPTELEQVRPGSTLRVRLDDSAVGRVQELTRSPQDGSVAGALLGVSPDSLVLSIWRTDLVNTGVAFRPGTVRVPLHRSDVVSVERKEVSTLRTGVLLTLLAGGAFFALKEAFGGSRGGISGGGGGGPDIILLPARLEP